ncbi:hypothetical protein [Crateriforma spongiae]|uniref:hypothetical protein n=1 Tax=Crateriforma spongiae TaxID=2724528 RepID=UPI00144648C6|nr:hypothetical protein [Crateriforma spongiae]
MTSRQQLAETAAWLDALYGRCDEADGHIVIASRHKNDQRSWWAAKSVMPIGSSRRLVDAARQMALLSLHSPGLYVKINPMDGHAMKARAIRDQKHAIVGNLDEVRTVVSFHLDVDATKDDRYLPRDEALRCLDAMPHPPTLIVNSDGADGGFHAYWLLEHPHRITDADDRVRIAGAAKRWQNRLKELTGGHLDTTANLDRVLRVVGQPRQNGRLVTTHSYHADRLYSLADLTIQPSVKEIRDEAAESARRRLVDILGPAKNTGRPVSDYIDAASITPQTLLADAGYVDLGGDEWLRPGSSSGSRSLMIATKNDRPGINVFSGSDPHFSCDDGGQVGKFYSVDQMFVSLRFGGDWKTAAAWCHRKNGLNKFTNLEAAG